MHVEVRRQIQQLVLTFYLVSERLSLFLSPSSLGFSHLHLHLPIAVLGFQLFTLRFWLLHELLGFELFLLTWQALWSTTPALSAPLSATHFTNLCLCHPVSWTLPTLNQKPKVICMTPESTPFTPMEEPLLAACDRSKFSAQGRNIHCLCVVMNLTALSLPSTQEGSGTGE